MPTRSSKAASAAGWPISLREYGRVRLFENAAGGVAIIEVFQQDGDAVALPRLAEIKHGPTDLERFVGRRCSSTKVIGLVDALACSFHSLSGSGLLQ